MLSRFTDVWVVSLHPAARAARPRRRHQGPGAPRPAPPARGAPPPGSTTQARVADRALLAAVSRVLPRARWSCFPRAARDAAALAAAPGRRRLDLPAPPDGSATAGPGDTRADRPAGQGAPDLGRPAQQGRAARPGLQVSATAVRSVLRRHGLGPPANLRVVRGGQPSRVHRRDRFSGLLHEYRRRAARTSFCTPRGLRRFDRAKAYRAALRHEPAGHRSRPSLRTLHHGEVGIRHAVSSPAGPLRLGEHPGPPPGQ